MHSGRVKTFEKFGCIYIYIREKKTMVVLYLFLSIIIASVVTAIASYCLTDSRKVGEDFFGFGKYETVKAPSGWVIFGIWIVSAVVSFKLMTGGF